MSQDKRHPKSTYKAKYPYNRVEITESGHEIHYDDTPGHERIRESHKSGTYRETSHDGKTVEVSVGNRFDYSKEGKTTTVDKNHDEKVGGSTRTSVGGGTHTEVKGNQSKAYDGDKKEMVGKDSVSAVKGDSVSGVAGKTKMRLGGDIEVKGDAKTTAKLDGDVSVENGGGWSHDSKGNYTLKATKITLEVGGSSVTIEGGKITLKSGLVDLTNQQRDEISRFFG